MSTALFVDETNFAPLERHTMPDGSEVWYRDSDHSYWIAAEMRKGEWCGKGRLAGVSTIAGTFDSGGDGLLNWSARLQGEGVAILASEGLSLENVDEMRTELRWLGSADAIWEALSDADLTWRDIRERAATRGTNVHLHALHALATGAPVPSLDEMTPEERGFARGVVSFWLDFDPETECAEQVVYDAEEKVAGRFDLLCRMGERVLVDLKTKDLVPRKKERPFYPPKDMVQTRLYDRTAGACGFKRTDSQYVLYVDADGDYELVRSHATDEDCEAALKVYRRMAEMKSAAGKAQRELKEAA